MRVYHSDCTIWKPVRGYEGLYEVSGSGLVRSTPGRIVTASDGRTWQAESNELSQWTNEGGYKMVSLRKDKKDSTVRVHRLVAEAFSEKPEGKDSVNHIDGDKENNFWFNLEWCTTLENNLHALDTGLHTSGTKVTLLHEETQATFVFRSLVLASKFLGKSSTYLSTRLNKYNGDFSTCVGWEIRIG